MDPVSAIAAITSVSGLSSRLYSLGENLIDAKKNFDKFQTWCWIYKVQVALIRKWADENSEAFEKIGKVDTRRLFNKVLKNINRILGSLEKLLSEVPDKSKGNLKRRVGVVSIGPDAVKTIETLDGLLSQVKTTMALLESTNGVTRESAKANGNTSQPFDTGLWSSLEVTPTKNLDVFVSNFFSHLNKKVLNEKGERAIHIAARMGNLPILDSLLRHGVETDDINVYKSTPLHMALWSQQEKSVDKLLDYSDASLSMRDDLGRSPLHVALFQELEDIAIQLIEKSPNSLSIATNSGTLPLHMAAQRCPPHAIRKILEHSNDTNLNSALTLALYPVLGRQLLFDEKRSESVGILLQRGADVTQSILIRGADYPPALHYLASRGETDLLKEIKVSWEGIVDMEYEKRLGAVQKHVNRQNTLPGSTPLYSAARGGHKETVKFLLEKGANPNIGLSAGPSSYAPTPLWAALDSNRVDIAKELLSCGASTNFEWCGNHMLHCMIENASARCRTDVVKLLLSHKADLYCKDKNELVPLVHAAKKGCIASLNALWDAYPKLEVPEADATDALIMACQEGRHSCVVLLYAKGVDINAKTKDGYTPLHFAARYGRDDVINVLLPGGADPTIVSSTRQDPFEAAGTAEAVARASGHVKTANLIEYWGIERRPPKTNRFFLELVDEF